MVDMEAGKDHKDVCSSSKDSGVDQRHPEESEAGMDVAGLAAHLALLADWWCLKGLWMLEHPVAVQMLAACQDSSDHTLLAAVLNLPPGEPQAEDGCSAPGSHAAVTPAWP